MSQAVRNRQNRTDNSQKMNEAFLGVMVSATAYDGDVRMVEINRAIPGSASMAGRMADGLLPTDD